MVRRPVAIALVTALAAAASVAISVAPASADAPASTVDLSGVPATIALPTIGKSGTARYGITVTDPIAGMSYRVEAATLTQGPYGAAIQPYSDISTSGSLTLGWSWATSGMRGRPGNVGGLQTLSVSVIGYVPNSDTEVALPTVTKRIRLIGRDTAAQSIAGGGFVRPGHMLTVQADTSVNAIGAKAKLWARKAGSSRWAAIASTVVKKITLSGSILPEVTFRTDRAAVGRLRITIAASARAEASTSASVRVVRHGGLIGVLGEDD